jgi:hypothetical protein
LLNGLCSVVSYVPISNLRIGDLLFGFLFILSYLTGSLERLSFDHGRFEKVEKYFVLINFVKGKNYIASPSESLCLVVSNPII